ncbi:MAG: hypothetical protein IJU54_02930 [Alphaproteobacteria bacterium]|nr:hypothetical protein [Alphaproteobacteria bacterium]
MINNEIKNQQKDVNTDNKKNDNLINTNSINSSNNITVINNYKQEINTNRNDNNINNINDKASNSIIINKNIMDDHKNYGFDDKYK